jgi:hypothetical protein
MSTTVGVGASVLADVSADAVAVVPPAGWVTMLAASTWAPAPPLETAKKAARAPVDARLSPSDATRDPWAA